MECGNLSTSVAMGATNSVYEDMPTARELPCGRGTEWESEGDTKEDSVGR
jgi:hypothetical protein